MFDCKQLSRISEPKTEKVTGWRKLQNKEIHNVLFANSTLKVTHLIQNTTTHQAVLAVLTSFM
jgi:hypothetical protein